jgi:cyanophycin synthetase
MSLRKILALRGPSIWASFPVLEAWVDLGPLPDWPSAAHPGSQERLLGWLPALSQRVSDLTSPAQWLEWVTLELQCLAGDECRFGLTQRMRDEGAFKVIVESHNEGFGKECLNSAQALLKAAHDDAPFDLEAEVARLRSVLHKEQLGPSTGAVVKAAVARGIPYRRLNAESLVMFGQGARQRRILATETDRTGTIAETIAQDKDLTRCLLKQVGVPVPEGRPVAGAEDAWDAAEEIGTPVVVKPRFGSQGQGVATDLRTREQVAAAYASLRADDWDNIVVERSVSGKDYRLLVIGGRLVAAARRDPAQVLGDGRSTIAQLVEQVNRDPRRGDDHATVLSKLVLDSIALAVLGEQGYTSESIPAAGHRVLIRRNANLSTGGTAGDVTDRVHPEVAARAVEAARVIGLDVAGVDVIAQDISRPLEEQGGVIVEVNAAPGLRMHLEPSAGTPRPVGDAIVSLLYPEGETGRIPIAAITGVNGKTTTTRLIAQMVRHSGKTVGMTCSDGIWVGNRCIEHGDCSGPKSAKAVLVNPRVEAAVLECARGGILREGLGFDRCDVAVVMNIGEGDHLGLSGIDTLEELARVKRTLVDVVLPHGAAVLKADDPFVESMAAHCPGSVIFFCRDPGHPVLQKARAEGRRVAFVRNQIVILAQGELELAVAPLSAIPLTYEGRIAFQVENVLAATAAAWQLGVPLEVIRSTLTNFISSVDQVPGRFNVLESNGAAVVIDYGHNPSALVALIEAISIFPQKRRSIVFSAEGDRRDQDIIRQTQMLGDAFDAVILYEYPNRRGRQHGEIMALLHQGLAFGTRVSETINQPDEPAAIAVALQALEPGDLLIIQPKEIEEVIAEVTRYLAEYAPVARRPVHGREPVLAGEVAG